SLASALGSALALLVFSSDALAFFDFLLVTVPYLVMNFSTRPSVSTNFCLPVKNGWHAEQISTWSFSSVEPVLNVLPHAQTTVASYHLGWIFSFTGLPFAALPGGCFGDKVVPQSATCAERHSTIDNVFGPDRPHLIEGICRA